MSTPQIQRTYPRTDDRPFAVEFHLQGCTCDACTQIPDAPLPWAKLAMAGAFTGNLIAFAWDPAGSWATLSTAVRHLIGAL